MSVTAHLGHMGACCWHSVWEETDVVSWCLLVRTTSGTQGSNCFETETLWWTSALTILFSQEDSLSFYLCFVIAQNTCHVTQLLCSLSETALSWFHRANVLLLIAVVELQPDPGQEMKRDWAGWTFITWISLMIHPEKKKGVNAVVGERWVRK